MQLVEVTCEDCSRAAEILHIYAEAKIGFVDASLVAVAERLKIRRVLTLDRRHFDMIRPRHCDCFEILRDDPLPAAQTISGIVDRLRRF